MYFHFNMLIQKLKMRYFASSSHTLQIQHISVPTSHISSAQEPHVAGGYQMTSKDTLLGLHPQLNSLTALCSATDPLTQAESGHWVLLKG